MTIAIDKEEPPLRRDETGTIRVGASRITLDIVITAFNMGLSAEVIAEDYPSITLAEVYATIAYYLRHRPQVDAYLAERDDESRRLRDEIEARPGYRELKDRLLARARARGLLP